MPLRLDRLNNSTGPIVGNGGNASSLFQRLWQRTVEALEGFATDIEQLVTDLAAALAAAVAAQAAADAAQDDATQALSDALAARTDAIQALTDAAAAQATADGAQVADATLTALAGLNATAGLVEQTGADTFTKRAMGVAASTDVLTRADGDGRYAIPARDMIAGAGLTGGGTLAADRTFAVGAGTGITVNADDVALTVETAHGTYTPTLTNTTNVAASTAYSCQYLRVGDTVTVSGRFDVDPTAAGQVRLGISIPIASSFVNAQDLAGVAFAVGIAGMGAGMLAVGSGGEARYIAVDTTNQAMYFTFTYLVR